MIIFQFDSAYHHWGLLALQSLQLHEPHTAVLCDTINLTHHQVEQLERAHARVVIENDTSSIPVTWPEQMAARKPFVLLQAMEQHPDMPWYGLFDADFLVRRPLQGLWSLLDSHPAALCIGDGMENGRFYPQLLVTSSIVLVRPSAKHLIECWARWYHYDKPLGSIEPLAWYWDQITLAEAWKEAGVPCAVIPMDVYGNEYLPATAAIWSANVPDKARYYQLFRDEYQRQLAEVAV